MNNQSSIIVESVHYQERVKAFQEKLRDSEKSIGTDHPDKLKLWNRWLVNMRNPNITATRRIGRAKSYKPAR
jgi:hypothetical protein